MPGGPPVGGPLPGGPLVGPPRGGRPIAASCSSSVMPDMSVPLPGGPLVGLESGPEAVVVACALLSLHSGEGNLNCAASHGPHTSGGTCTPSGIRCSLHIYRGAIILHDGGDAQPGQ